MLIREIRGKNLTSPHLWRAALILGLLLLAAYLGRRPSSNWIMLLAVGGGAFALLRTPQLGLLALIAAALVGRFDVSTGTEVVLNIATLLIPALFALWLLDSLRRSELRWAGSPVDRPLVLFLVAGLFSLLIGNILWEPSVPKSANFWLVQLAQWAIFAFAALAFWLMANLRDAEVWLPRSTWFFLYVSGGLLVLRLIPGIGGLIRPLASIVFIRAPFTLLLTALAGGQLLFDANLNKVRRVFLFVVLVAMLYYVFVDIREAASHWVGFAAVSSVLFWLRYPQLRRIIITLAILLILTDLFFPNLYEFAGGDDEWEESGGSRLVLIGRVVEVTLRNPLTGLGPASYRNYANMEPLRYQRALWMNPKVNSHNNYVDLFAHTGLVGLALFAWFAWKLFWLGWRLSAQHTAGFTGGYVNGMTAAWVGSLTIMLLADWMLPFVYNIGFPGFQASLLVWLFLGGLAAVREREGEGVRGRAGESGSGG